MQIAITTWGSDLNIIWIKYLKNDYLNDTLSCCYLTIRIVLRC